MLKKLDKLKSLLKEMESVAVAYSAGVDSTFLLKVAHDVLGDKAIAVTINSSVVPNREVEKGKEFCNAEGIRHEVLLFDEMSVEEFRHNPKNRCYYCKTSVFSQIKKVAQQNNLNFVCEGSNIDDLGDYRPGLKAIQELAVRSPLREAGLTKADIRELSKLLKLPTWDKPSFACLASRVPYGEEITYEKLKMIGAAEQLLFDMGLKQFRVRLHDCSKSAESLVYIARIEILREDFDRVIQQNDVICSSLKKLGFSYITLDLQGFRSGSMNEVIKTKDN